MASHLALIFVLVSCFTCFSNAYDFVVGGKRGWIVNQSETYNHWAERMRFQVNDTLLFKYDKAQDSVLLVNRDDYDRCNTGNPIERFNDGSSTFKFSRSGPFYFISGNQTNCNNGQKLFIIVMAVRNRPTPHANAPAPQENAPAPDASLSPAPTGLVPSSPTPSPDADGPAGSSPAGNTSATPGPRHSFAGPACDPSYMMIIFVVSVALGFLVV